MLKQGSSPIWSKMNTLLKAYKPTPLATASFLHIIKEMTAETCAQRLYQTNKTSIKVQNNPETSISKNHWNSYHVNKTKKSFGVYSYRYCIENKCCVLNLGPDPQKKGSNCYKQLQHFFDNALPGDNVYINGHMGPKKSKEKCLITHYGVWTGRVFTNDLSDYRIRYFIDKPGCNFEQGTIGTGLTDDFLEDKCPIYIELSDFQELPGPHVQGPGRLGTMLYDVKPGQTNHLGKPFPFA